MFDKKLAVLYFYSPGNEAIAGADFDAFYLGLRDNPAFRQAGIKVEHHFCPTPAALLASVENIVEDQQSEIYLHFSGHGTTEGIPYDDWLLQNDYFAAIVDHPKVVFCFFSSCKSADLLRVVQDRKIPIVLGTAGDNNIENTFAIELQKRFYQLLAEKRNFKQAFEQAYNKVELSQQTGLQKTVLVRGELLPQDLEGDLKNELQIVFRGNKDQKRHLIYPTIVDAFEIRTAERQPVFVYAENDNLLDKFRQSFVKKGYDEFFALFLLRESELVTLTKVEAEGIFLEDLKILFLVDSERDYFENAAFRKVFDDEKKFTDYDHLRFALAVREGVNSQTAFQNASFFSSAAGGWPAIRYQPDRFDELFEASEFDKFLTQLEIDQVLRRECIMAFPCTPTKEEVEELDEDNNVVRVFFGNAIDEKLINYIVNFLVNYYEFRTPIIIADSLYAENDSILDSLKTAIGKVYHSDAMYRNTLNVSLSLALGLLVANGHIIVFRTDEEDTGGMIARVRELILEFDKISLDQIPDFPTFIFFINKGQLSLPGEGFRITRTKGFSPPESVTLDAVKAWTRPYRTKRSLKEIILDIQAIEFEVYHDPSSVLELVCDKLKIPRRQILNIS